MTPFKLIALRTYMATLGRFDPLARLLRWLLVEMLIRRKSPGERYAASSRFFDAGDFEDRALGLPQSKIDHGAEPSVQKAMK